MSCNCGKPSQSPLGGKPKPQGSSTQTAQESGGLSGRTQSFTLQMPNGSTSKFVGSQLEAAAEAVRRGAAVQF